MLDYVNNEHKMRYGGGAILVLGDRHTHSRVIVSKLRAKWLRSMVSRREASKRRLDEAERKRSEEATRGAD